MTNNDKALIYDLMQNIKRVANAAENVLDTDRLADLYGLEELSEFEKTINSLLATAMQMYNFEHRNDVKKEV